MTNNKTFQSETKTKDNGAAKTQISPDDLNPPHATSPVSIRAHIETEGKTRLTIPVSCDRLFLKNLEHLAIRIDGSRRSLWLKMIDKADTASVIQRLEQNKTLFSLRFIATPQNSDREFWCNYFSDLLKNTTRLKNAPLRRYTIEVRIQWYNGSDFGQSLLAQQAMQYVSDAPCHWHNAIDRNVAGNGEILFGEPTLYLRKFRAQKWHFTRVSTEFLKISDDFRTAVLPSFHSKTFWLFESSFLQITRTELFKTEGSRRLSVEAVLRWNAIDSTARDILYALWPANGRTHSIDEDPTYRSEVTLKVLVRSHFLINGLNDAFTGLGLDYSNPRSLVGKNKIIIDDINEKLW